MSLIPCRVLPFVDAPGPRQMALDHALLDSVDRDPTFAVFRTYSWSEPTLSLGYFQPIAEAEREGRFAEVAIVRRLTGGGAIWHDRDLTYALIVPRSLELAHRASDLYRAVHGAIADSLARLGVPVQARGKESQGRGRIGRSCASWTVIRKTWFSEVRRWSEAPRDDGRRRCSSMGRSC